MRTSFELWNDTTNNLIDEFATVEQALEEVRRRIAVDGQEGARALTLLRLDGEAAEVVVAGDDLIHRAQAIATPAISDSGPNR